MEMNIGSRLKHAWNAFLNRDPPGSRYYGGGYSYRPDRMRFSRGSERTIINNFTPEAYFYPPEFGECDGSAEVAPGVTISQQKRKPFGLTWQTLIGSDEDDELGFTLHLVWGATASPSERSHESYNDSPDAETFSWDCDTTPVKVTGYKPTAHMELDSTKVPQAKMEKLLNILYGTANTTPYLPLPDEVIKLMTT